MDFIKNIIDSGFNQDLNVYRGFAPPEHLLAEGLIAPSWGYTFKFLRGPQQSFHGVYVGAGPYFSLKTDLRWDENLVRILGNSQPVAVPPNTTFRVSNSTAQQAAVAITGGYRAKFTIPSSFSFRDGVYLGMNFNYLHGLRHDAGDLNLRIETDNAGLLTVTPSQVPFFLTDYRSATSGKGFSVDAGVALVQGGWEFGVGVNGIANRIEWDAARRKQFTLTGLSTGVDFTETALPSSKIESKLPTRYVANLGRHHERWSTLIDYAYGFEKSSLHGGGEYRLGSVAIRGGAKLSRSDWNPTGGLGLNFTRRLGIDVAVFGTNANLETKREFSVAMSLRILSAG